MVTFHVHIVWLCTLGPHGGVFCIASLPASQRAETYQTYNMQLSIPMSGEVLSDLSIHMYPLLLCRDRCGCFWSRPIWCQTLSMRTGKQSFETRWNNCCQHLEIFPHFSHRFGLKMPGPAQNASDGAVLRRPALGSAGAGICFDLRRKCRLLGVGPKKMRHVTASDC